MESLPEETQKQIKKAIKNGKLDEFFEENIKVDNKIEFYQPCRRYALTEKNQKTNS